MNLQDAKDAVAYIPLLDVVSDTGGDNIFPKKLTDPAQDVTVTSEPFVFTATGNDQEEPSSSAPKELPWSMASKKIKSPTLRLHHGETPSNGLPAPSLSLSSYRQLGDWADL